MIVVDNMKDTELWWSENRGFRFPELREQGYSEEKLDKLKRQVARSNIVYQRVEQIKDSELSGDIVGVVYVPDKYEFSLGLTEVEWIEI